MSTKTLPEVRKSKLSYIDRSREMAWLDKHEKEMPANGWSCGVIDSSGTAMIRNPLLRRLMRRVLIDRSLFTAGANSDRQWEVGCKHNATPEVDQIICQNGAQCSAGARQAQSLLAVRGWQPVLCG